MQRKSKRNKIERFVSICSDVELRMRIWGAMLLCGASALIGATAPEAGYGEGDFARVAKFDAHVHANVDDPRFLELARRDGFQVLAINVDYPDFPPVPLQATIAHAMRKADPKRFQFATTFSMQGFGTPGWTERTIRAVDAAVASGAVAVKVWKNIGMVAKDAQGKRVFIDDPRFDGVIAHLEKRGFRSSSTRASRRIAGCRSTR
jgi:hypothetical protein